MSTETSIFTEYNGLLLIKIKNKAGRDIGEQIICNHHNISLLEFIRIAYIYFKGEIISRESLDDLAKRWRILCFSPQERVLEIQET